MVPNDHRHTICHFPGHPDGPLLVCIGGLHGNEPSGVAALTRVCESLQPWKTRLHGEFLGIAGNLRALASGSRFISEDLNRIWTEPRVAGLRSLSTSEHLRDEAVEQWELLSVIDELLETRAGKVFFVDLHTTSAVGGPFTVFGDTLSNREFAREFPVPMILGLEEQIEGTLMEFVSKRGAVALGFEAGEHDSPESLARQEAAIWIALTATGIVERDDFSNLQEQRAKLEKASTSLPRVVEVIYRHAVTEEDRFSMEPGFSNFDRIREGQIVARDKNGEISAPHSGRVLLPLYQAQGSDGYFLVREVWPFWLRVSKFLRRFHLDLYIHLLPGVQPHPTREGVLFVDSSVARWRTVEIFHLLGFRRWRPEGKHMVFLRR